MKEEEAKALQSDLKTNLTVANMANEVFKQCLIGDKNSQGFKGCAEAICGNGYVNCVSPAQGGIVTSKLLEVGTTCYPSYKICMDTVAKTLNVNNMSPQLKSIVLDIQQDPQKMQDLAMETIKESLGEEYQKALEKTCEEAGGFYDNGICGIGIVSEKNVSTEWKAAFSSTSSGGSGKGAWSKALSEESSGGKKSFESKTGVMLPGASLTCMSKEEEASKKTSNNTGNSAYASVSVSCIDGVGAGAYGVGTGSDSSSASASASCSVSADARMVKKDGDDLEVADKCGGSFIPKGWDAVIGKAGCIAATDRIKLPTNSSDDTLQMVIQLFSGKDICKPKGHVKYQFEKQILDKWRDIFKKEDEKSK